MKVPDLEPGDLCEVTKRHNDPPEAHVYNCIEYWTLQNLLVTLPEGTRVVFLCFKESTHVGACVVTRKGVGYMRADRLQKVK